MVKFRVRVIGLGRFLRVRVRAGSFNFVLMLSVRFFTGGEGLPGDDLGLYLGLGLRLGLGLGLGLT